MKSEHLNALRWSESNKNFLTKRLNTLKSKKGFDKRVKNAHNEVFAETNCLECGNCCRTTGPLLTSNDIDRLATKLKMSPAEFVAKFLRKDEEGDFVFKSMPCPFLGDDNYCSVYDSRPRACREYPHTHQNGQAQLLKLTRKNARICPAVSKILQIVIDSA